MNIRDIKRQRNIQQWKEIISARCNSGMFVDDYCKQNGISRHAYFYWLRIIREEEVRNTIDLPRENELPSDNRNRFVEVSVPDTYPHKPLADEQSLVLSLNGIEIKVTENTPTSLLARALEVIRNAQ